MSFQLTGLFFMIVALISMVRQPLTRNRRLWIAGQFLLAGALFWTSEGFERKAEAWTSMTATFNSISAEGPQRQLVFHYTVENRTSHAFQIGANACSTLSFRFAKKLATTPAMPQPNPALSVLEQDHGTYAQLTGLERLPTKNSALSLDQCPLELQPKESRAVAIAIPYAYPEAVGKNPSANDLKIYVRAFMPQMNGFGLLDLTQHYVIVFPRSW